MAITLPETLPFLLGADGSEPPPPPSGSGPVLPTTLPFVLGGSDAEGTGSRLVVSRGTRGTSQATATKTSTSTSRSVSSWGLSGETTVVITGNAFGVRVVSSTGRRGSSVVERTSSKSQYTRILVNPVRVVRVPVNAPDGDAVQAPYGTSGSLTTRVDV